jgi:ferric-dicitrate binding protein FerR (iron transport regulator)
MALADAAAQFANYHGCSITVDLSVAQLRLGGTYSLKNLPLFMEALKSTGAVQIMAPGDGSYRIVGH